MKKNTDCENNNHTIDCYFRLKVYLECLRMVSCTF